MDYCCEAMWKQFEIESDEERLVFHQPEFSEYGLVDRKDPTAYIPIGFCPWCGKDILSPRFKAIEKTQADRPVDGDKADEAPT